MFVEIVSKAAKFFRLLFTPFALYVHKGKKYFKYKRILKKGGDDKDMEWLKVCRQKTWVNFDNPKGDPDWSKVSNELLVGACSDMSEMSHITIGMLCVAC